MIGHRIDSVGDAGKVWQSGNKSFLFRSSLPSEIVFLDLLDSSEFNACCEAF